MPRKSWDRPTRAATMTMCGGYATPARLTTATGRYMGGPARRPPAEPVIVGRDAERVLLTAFLDDGLQIRTDPVVAGSAGSQAGNVAAILTGPAGIGKTALWEWAVGLAATMGYLVLTARTGVAEAQMPWVALTDLLRTTTSSVLAGLPPPQRSALHAVMLQSEAGAVVDERTVGTALWSVLSAQAAAGPVLIALDDLPNLDTASAGALRFALRRMA